jgi:DNA-binding Lrp family transcriptional regulator
LQAYILVTAEPSKLWEVAEATLKIKGVKTAHAVTGLFDVIVFVETPKLDTLGEILNRILLIGGVLHTQTAIVMPERLETTED